MRYEIFKSFERRNKLLGIHINKVKDRYGQVHDLGFNPFEYLGFSLSQDGSHITLLEWKNEQWKVYNEINPLNLNWTLPKDHYGKSYSLDKFFKTYCWINDNGYSNFSNWIS